MGGLGLLWKGMLHTGNEDRDRVPRARPRRLRISTLSIRTGHKNDERRKTKFYDTDDQYIKIQQGDKIKLKTESNQVVELYIVKINNKNKGTVGFEYKMIDN